MVREFVLYELGWILPLLGGIVALAHVIYSFRRREAASLILRSFILSVVVLFIGAAGGWHSGLAIWRVAGVTGDISLDLLYSGWKHSWWPLIISGGATLLLISIAVLAFHRRSQLPSVTPMELSRALAIPAVGVLILVLIGFLVEVLFDPFNWPHPTMPAEGWIYRLMALGAIGYFALAILGIPYAIFWGLTLWRRRSAQPSSAVSKSLIVFFVSFSIVAIGFTSLFIVSAVLGHNPFLFE